MFCPLMDDDVALDFLFEELRSYYHTGFFKKIKSALLLLNDLNGSSELC